VSVGLPDTRPLNARPTDDSGGSETRLVIVCADRAGIVASVAGFLRDAGAKITRSDQHSTDPAGGTFLMRMEFSLPMDGDDRAEFEQRFDERVGGPLEMQ
jgi:formyltetrahydrofolate deformylase